MTELTHFTVTVDDGVAVVLMDRAGESINTLGPVLIDEFGLLLDYLESESDVKSVVLGSAKRDFVVGADIRWFSELTTIEAADEAIRHGQMLMNRLEDLHLRRGKPVVAAIAGAALGGGCELALACSIRLVADDERTQLGQPEIRLGVIPAGGGTQRLPHLVGIANSLDLILTGKSVRPKRAKKLGLVDEIVPPELLLDVAVQRAQQATISTAARRGPRASMTDRVTKMALESNAMGRRLVFSRAREKLIEETKGNYPAPERALEAVRIGVEQGRSAGLDAESRFFAELVVSPPSKALRSVFFATRELDKERWGVTGEPKAVARVGVIGGGLMGGGIAAVSTLGAGATVRLKEVDPAGVGRGLGHVARSIASLVDRKRLTPFEGERARLRVTGGITWHGFAGVDLVIEAVFEDLALKRSTLAEVESIVTQQTVFATNTSSIPIAVIAAGAKHPDRILGMHYFSPVEKMPLLEIVVTPEASDHAISTAVAFGKRQGKNVIVVGDCPGFYTSRVLGPYSTEAMHLLAEGAAIEDVDQAMEEWGFPVGPIRLADEVGLDVGAKVTPILIEAYGQRMAGPDVLSALIADDRMGRKNRRGFYSYDDDGKRTGVDESVYEVMGLGPRHEIARLDIQRRISLALVNEAARCLEEGILRSARDGDIGAIMGFGFPPFRGGPFWFVDHLGASDVVRQLDDLVARHGDRFEPAAILREAAKSGTKFRT